MTSSNDSVSPPDRTWADTDTATNRQHDPSTMLAVALEMAGYGWRVFPVYPPVNGKCPCSNPACTTPGKHPAITKWQDRATTDETKIREWWEAWPHYNVGIATGRESNLLVLDAYGAEGLMAVSERGVPSGPMVQTGRENGGTHYYFACPDDFDARNFAGKVPGLDARANGGYVIVPGSRHASGATYRWATKPDGRLPEPPQWLIDLHKQKRAMQGPVGAKIPKGLRDDTLFSMARTMSRKGFDEESILDALRIENRKKCDVPLPEADLEQIAASAMRYGPDDELLALPQSDAGNAERFAYLWGATTRYCVEDKDWLHCDVPGFEGLWKPSTPKAMHHKLIETARQFQIAAAAMPAAIDERQVARRSMLAFSQKLENDRAYKAMKQMAASHLTILRAEFDQDRERLPCLNGVIDLRTGELLPHDPGGFHLRPSPVEYSPDFIDPVLEKFLDHITAGVPGMAEALQIKAGYFATGYAREEGFDFFVGPGGSGKSTTGEMIMAALGSFAVPMDAETFMKQDVTARSHTEDLMQLEGRRLAVIQEPDDNRRMRIGLLKKISGSDMMTGRGIYEKERQFRNQAKLVFAFNKAPDLPPGDTGVERRLWVWPFNNGVSEAEKDHTIKAHLVESDEGRMAVLAWIVEGARKYLALDKLLMPDFVQVKTKELLEQNDVIATFVEEQCSTGPEDKTQYTPLWEAFERWNRQEGGPPIKGKEFRDWLDTHGHVSQRANGITTRRGIRYTGNDLFSGFRSSVGASVGDP